MHDEEKTMVCKDALGLDYQRVRNVVGRAEEGEAGGEEEGGGGVCKESWNYQPARLSPLLLVERLLPVFQGHGRRRSRGRRRRKEGKGEGGDAGEARRGGKRRLGQVDRVCTHNDIFSRSTRSTTVADILVDDVLKEGWEFMDGWLSVGFPRLSIAGNLGNGDVFKTTGLRDEYFVFRNFRFLLRVATATTVIVVAADKNEIERYEEEVEEEEEEKKGRNPGHEIVSTIRRANERGKRQVPLGKSSYIVLPFAILQLISSVLGISCH
ncbi:hypothetical protein M0802_002766 [Mischocyttarus mexicanus]|nr:hypothetical protein M0802_002766 [Mischocyttarus mexicanus]